MSSIQARLRALTHHTITRRAARLAAPLATVALILSVPDTAFADPTGPVYLAANTLPQVIANLQSWIMGILAAVATLFLVLAGVGPPLVVTRPRSTRRRARYAMR